MREEVRSLRDKLEEEEWARANLEKKVLENAGSVENGVGVAEVWKKELKGS